MQTLAVKELSKSYNGRQVVSSVTFEISEGEVVGLLGPNGAGKTTSFYMVIGLVYPEKGRVYLNQQDITFLPMHERAQQGMGYLPQNVSIFRKLTVKDNLLAFMEIAKIPSKDHSQQLDRLLEKFRISHIQDSYGAALSGGERRRVEIARALILNPRFLLLDEPFAGVDPLTVQEVQSIIAELKDDGIGVLITDHNVRETLQSCTRAYVLSGGRIIAQGVPEDITSNAEVKKTYLGENFSF